MDQLLAPLRFLTIKMVCPGCGWKWSARIAVFRRDGEKVYEHCTGECCEVCGVDGEPTGMGVLALADALDSIEGQP